MKSNIEQLVQMAYGRNIVAIDWPPFARTLVITLDGAPGLRLILRGVHYCSSRQSLLGPDNRTSVEGCEIYALDLTQEHPFLNHWLEKRISFAADVVIYDTVGTESSSVVFRRPFYLYIVASAGNLDVIFESWEIAIPDP